jgi:hypothetical protein
MKKLWILFILNCLTIYSFAQREADSFYFGGYDGGEGCQTCLAPQQGNIFWFNQDSIQEIIDPACFKLATYFSKATFSNKNTGELIFASNGWRLIDNDGVILTHKLYFDNMPHPGGGDTTDVYNQSGPLFLPHPGDSTKAYLLYGQLFTPFVIGGYNLRADKFFTYALLDIPSKTLISKNNLILSDTSMNGDMQACRHANGRDWWIVKPHIYSDLYYIGLLTPQGIEMQLIQIPNVPHNLRINSSSKFNIQGTKYIQYVGGIQRLIHEYDFDRCNGTLSNFVVHDISDSIAPNDNGLATMTISPDGSKFYIQRNNTIFPSLTQGLYQVDFATNSMELIARYGGTPQMMPNGKKIIFREDSLVENIGWYSRVSEINNPNASFNELDIHHFKYNPPNALDGIAPNNFAYMRLGADTLSICDSLSVITKKSGLKENGGLALFPNPATYYLQTEVQEQGTTQYKITNYYGQVVQFWQSNQITQNIELSNLNNGFYLLQATSNAGRVVQKKFVIQR